MISDEQLDKLKELNGYDCAYGHEKARGEK
jgi:hypothetical protein